MLFASDGELFSVVLETDVQPAKQAASVGGHGGVFAADSRGFLLATALWPGRVPGLARPDETEFLQWDGPRNRHGMFARRRLSFDVGCTDCVLACDNVP